MVTLIVAGQQLYVEKGGNQTIYYLIGGHGDLKKFNAQGIIMTYRKIK